MIGDACINEFGDFMRDNSVIEVVRFGNLGHEGHGNILSDEFVTRLPSLVLGCKKLRILDLSSNVAITNKSKKVLKECIAKSSIQWLDVFGTSITDVGLISASLAINKMKNGSKKLDLSRKFVHDFICFLIAVQK